MKRLRNVQVATEIVAGAKGEVCYLRRFSDCYSHELFNVQPTG